MIREQKKKIMIRKYEVLKNKDRLSYLFFNQQQKKMIIIATE